MPKDDILDKILGKDKLDEDGNKIKNENDNDDDDPDNKGDNNDNDNNNPKFVTLDEFNKLQKQNKGLIKDLQKERTTRQEFKGKFEQLSATVNDVLTKQRQNQTTDDDDKKKLKGLPIEHDDDGNPYVPQSAIDALRQEIHNQISPVGKAVQDIATTNQQNADAKAALDAVLNKKPEYGDAYRQVAGARQWVQDKVVEWQQQTGYDQMVSEDQVLTLISKGEIDLSEFNKNHEGLDIEQVIRSHTNEYNLTKALEGVLELGQQNQDNNDQGDNDGDSTKNNKANDSVFNKVLSKPSSLGNTSNAKGSKVDPFERIAQVSTEDLLDLTDADAAALEEAMEREERQDYGS